MHKKLSRHTLFQLRNDIPIDFVIQDVLHIPFKISEGFLRFLCPLCHEFNSATNPKTNLARCFRCQTNFNPIDLVMAEKNIPFRHATDILLPLLHASSSTPSPASSTPLPKSSNSSSRTSLTRPCSNSSSPNPGGIHVQTL